MCEAFSVARFDMIVTHPLQMHDVPQLLYAVKDTILTTGKYLNAIRECGRQPSSPLEDHERLVYDPHGQHVQQIHRYDELLTMDVD